jgi:acyl-CoA reductase-like NAD-dependent aldehyde dehydrogenase
MSTSTIDASDAGLLIAGEVVAGDGEFDVINPATGQPFASAPDCSRDQLDAAFMAASDAASAWAADAAARRAAIGGAAAALGGAAEALAPLLTAEQGKPLHEAIQEIQGAAYWLSYYAGLELPRDVIQDDDTAIVEVLRRPTGVVAAITPWNFPLVLACWKIGPALAAGCTMVLKPSPFTLLSTLKMGEILSRELPAGVLNVVTGGDELGSWMTSHPIPRKISFTGSVATGKRVFASAADDLKRVTLELGGNDPAILLDDADPAAIAQGLFWSATLNAGQVCCAVKRVYAPRRLYDEVVEALAEQARQVVVGDGATAGTTMGPVNNAAQHRRVSELVSDALAAGAEAVVGGTPEGADGYFFAPTVLANARDGMRIVDEEQFGPVIPVVAYDTVEEAVEHANRTNFGLSGSVWGADGDRAAAIARRLECGTAWVNTHLINAPHQPFGGMKWSGVGVENGPWGLESFTELQVVHKAKGSAA